MPSTAIPFLLMRAGTSRGAFLQAKHLPTHRGSLSAVLAAVFGAGHPLNIDGIGGGTSVTTKVAMLSPSTDPSADVDYFFAQVGVDSTNVDYQPTCGNMLSGVGPAALEMGLVAPTGPETNVKIRAVNTGANVTATVQTAFADDTTALLYDGDTAIDGVPGTAAPIPLLFKNVVGGITGALLPTGRPTDEIDGMTVSCVDVSVPMVIAHADSLGLSGQETAEEIDGDGALMDRIERTRIAAGALMGLGDVSKAVAPKFGIVSRAKGSGKFAARYFTPWNCHPSMAVTGSQCLAACFLIPGTVANGLGELPTTSPATIRIEHPSGTIDVIVDYEMTDGNFALRSAGIVRTARKIADGTVFVPADVWDGERELVIAV